jgi:hypothetical protein
MVLHLVVVQEALVQLTQLQEPLLHMLVVVALEVEVQLLVV